MSTNEHLLAVDKNLNPIDQSSTPSQRLDLILSNLKEGIHTIFPNHGVFLINITADHGLLSVVRTDGQNELVTRAEERSRFVSFMDQGVTSAVLYQDKDSGIVFDLTSRSLSVISGRHISFGKIDDDRSSQTALDIMTPLIARVSQALQNLND